MATNKRKSKKTKTAETSVEPLVVPERIFAQASPRSLGGVSMFEAQNQIDMAFNSWGRLHEQWQAENEEKNS